MGESPEVDFVVMPREFVQAPSPNRCLYGANVIPFWVFLKTARRYELVLKIHVHDLTILDTKSNGYHDIQTSSSAAKARTILVFKFDGKEYKLHKKTADDGTTGTGAD